MTVPKRNGLFVINVVIPLLLGFFIYLTKEERTYLSDMFPTTRSMIELIKYPNIVRNYACDCLWAYSMFFCIRLALGDSLKGRYNLWVLFITVFAAIIMELLQLAKVFPGFFDSMDIILEIVAITAAYLITTIIERRFIYEKE